MNFEMVLRRHSNFQRQCTYYLHYRMFSRCLSGACVSIFINKYLCISVVPHLCWWQQVTIVCLIVGGKVWLQLTRTVQLPLSYFPFTVEFFLVIFILCRFPLFFSFCCFSFSSSAINTSSCLDTVHAINRRCNFLSGLAYSIWWRYGNWGDGRSASTFLSLTKLPPSPPHSLSPVFFPSLLASIHSCFRLASSFFLFSSLSSFLSIQLHLYVITFFLSLTTLLLSHRFLFHRFHCCKGRLSIFSWIVDCCGWCSFARFVLAIRY